MDAVVIDTNVFVSAVMGAATPPRQVLRLSLQRTVLPLMGNALFAEYEDVLSRKDLFLGSALSEDERWKLFDAFMAVCRWVPVYYLWRPNLPDEADNHLIELALAGNATWLVTGNTSDLEAGELLFPDLRIVRDATFINERS